MTARAPRPRIAVALDPDDAPGLVLTVAAELADRAGAELEIVSVARPGQGPRVLARLHQIRAEVRSDCSVRRLEGANVIGELLDHLSATGPDLLVLGTHRRGADPASVLGSVSADIVRCSPVPTLLIGPAVVSEAGFGTFVVGIDGSSDAMGALGVAADLGCRLGLAVRLVEIADEGVDVVTELCARASDSDTTALVVGAHGRSPGRPRVMGSVAARAVRQSTVPVMVVSSEAVSYRQAHTMRPSSAADARPA